MNSAYSKVISEIEFQDYSSFNSARARLEEKIKGHFSGVSGFEGPKLVGSAATGTMREGRGDLDFFVVFDREMDILEFRAQSLKIDLDFHQIIEEIRYNYIRLAGEFENYSFVLVPVKNPREVKNIKTYTQDAFYHADFINNNKGPDHKNNVLLTKSFFDKLGLYKTIQGIGCELMILRYRSFDKLLNEIVINDKIRVNFSHIAEEYSNNPIIVDYPFLGKRSLVHVLTERAYKRIQTFASSVLEDPNSLLG